MMLLHRPPVSLRRATATTSAAQPAHERPLTGSSTNVTEYGFHIGHFDVETVGKVKLDESVLMMSNPTVVATADVCAEPQTDQAEADLANWKVGLSRTVYEDRITWIFENGLITDRMTETTGGPVLDVDPSLQPFDTPMDHRNATNAAMLIHNPLRMKIMDAPPASLSLEQLSDRPEYTSYEKLLNFSRRFDASVFLLAKNEVTNEVHTLDQIAYTQVSRLHFSDKPGKKDSPFGTGDSFHERWAKIIDDGRAQIEDAERTPELMVKGGGMANDFQPNLTFNEWEE